MMSNSYRRAWLASLLMPLLFVGCTTLEQRSELPDKKPLPALQTPVAINRVWQMQAGSGVRESNANLELSLVGNSLYTADEQGRVYNIALEDGIINWERALGTKISSGPSYANSKLLLASSDGRVLCFALRNRALDWTTSLSSEIQAVPRSFANRVYVNTMDGGLNALALSDGQLEWNFQYSPPALVLRRAASPAYIDGKVVAGFANGRVIALQAGDGSVLWSHELARPAAKNELASMNDISADPVISDGKVYVASYQGSMQALNVSNGALVWERDISSLTGFSIDTKAAYVAMTDGRVIALDKQTGSSYWQQDALQGRTLSKIVIVGKYLVCGDDDGNVHVLLKDTGKLAGHQNFDKAGIIATPVVKNNTIYILGRSGKLAAFQVG